MKTSGFDSDTRNRIRTCGFINLEFIALDRSAILVKSPAGIGPASPVYKTGVLTVKL